MDKVDIRMFALEQIVKMRCMSDCRAEDLVEQAKIIEDYILGVSEYSTLYEA